MAMWIAAGIRKFESGAQANGANGDAGQRPQFSPWI